MTIAIAVRRPTFAAAAVFDSVIREVVQFDLTGLGDALNRVQSSSQQGSVSDLTGLGLSAAPARAVFPGVTRLRLRAGSFPRNFVILQGPFAHETHSFRDDAVEDEFGIFR